MCEELGIVNPIMLIDKRTIELIEEYSYYSSKATSPAPYDNKVWFDVVTTCKKYEMF